MPAHYDVDLLIAGTGPAGRALASRAAIAGLSVVAVDPHPDRRWTATYGAWADELPTWVPAEVVTAEIAAPAAHTAGLHTIDRTYRVFDTAALQDQLSLDEVSVLAGRVRALEAHRAELDDGRHLTARCVVDARGVAAVPERAQQTAFGVVVDAERAAPALEGRQAWFMDWRRDNGTSAEDVPSFLYAVPVGDGQILLEETCLVGRPALAPTELRRRLRRRLNSRGVAITGDERTETVRFSVEAGAVAPGVIGYGARGGLMHPATGYAVATALAGADRVVRAVRNNEDPNSLLWPRSARAVATLRRLGLRVLLRLDGNSAQRFFAAFFELPVERQRAYLSGRDDPAAVAATMWQLFRMLPPELRGTILRSVR